MGPRTLCNACGLVYAKMIKKRARDSHNGGNTRPNGQTLSSQQNTIDVDSGEGDSDDGVDDDDDVNDDGPSQYRTNK